MDTLTPDLLGHDIEWGIGPGHPMFVVATHKAAVALVHHANTYGTKYHRFGIYQLKKESA